MADKIVVTGGSGFVGGYAARHLHERGYGVLNFDMVPAKEFGGETVMGSILDRELVTRLAGESNAIFHFAGFSNINKVKDDPIRCIELNIMSTAYFLDALKDRKSPFILASSVYVNDDNGHFYTSSKFCAERVCHNYHEMFGVAYSILRLGTVYGEKSRHEDVISIFIRKALAGEPLLIHGDGSQLRHFIHGEDVAEACERVLRYAKEGGGGTFVLAGAEEVSIRQLAELVRNKIPGTKMVYSEGDARIADYSGIISGREKTWNALNWRPKVTVEEGIERMIRLYRK